jgi:uncharacterized protein
MKSYPKSLSHALFAGLFAALSICAYAQEGPQLNLQRIKISAGMHQIDTQLAMTPMERQIGLMNRPPMKACFLSLNNPPNNAFG